MAKPDLENGYLMVAHELMAAVMVAHIPQESRIVLFEVFSQIYGPAKLKAATLRPGEIAGRTGLKPNNVSRAITWLVDHGMLRREGLNTFYFLKNYDGWKGEGKPVLPGLLASYAAHAPRLAMSHNFSQSSHTSTKKPIKSDIKTEIAHEPDALETADLISVAMGKPIGSDTSLPYREKREVVVEDEGTASTGPSIRIVSSPQPGPEDRTPDGDPAIWSRRPFRPDPADVEKAKALVDAIDPMSYLGQKVEYLKSAYPLDWIVKAFVKAAGQADKIAPFANTLLITAWQRGYWIDAEDFAKEPRPDRPPATDPFISRPAAARLTPAQERRRVQLEALNKPRPDTKERA